MVDFFKIFVVSRSIEILIGWMRTIRSTVKSIEYVRVLTIVYIWVKKFLLHAEKNM